MEYIFVPESNKIRRMEEFNLEDMMPVKAIEQQIWSMFDILRGNSIGSNDYHIILLFLSLYKDDQISKEFLFDENLINLEEARILSDSNSYKSPPPNSNSSFQT